MTTELYRINISDICSDPAELILRLNEKEVIVPRRNRRKWSIVCDYYGYYQQAINPFAYGQHYQNQEAAI